MMLLRTERALAAAAAGLLALGGHAAAAGAAITYDFALGAGVTANDNFYLDPEPDAPGQRGPVRETTFFTSPTFTLGWVGPLDSLRADYRGEYWRFSGDEELDPRWSHNMAAGLTWRRWRPFFLEASETLTFGPSPQDRELQPVIDYVYTNRVAARAGLVWRLGGKSEAQVAYRGELESYPGEEGADRILRQYGEGSLRYQWTPLWSGEVRVSYGHVERELAADYDELVLSAAADQRLGKQLALRYRIEWLRDTTDAVAGEDRERDAHNSFLGSVEVRGDVRALGYWRLAYDDELDYLEDGDTLETRRASAGLGLSSRRGSALGVELWHDDRDYQGSGRGEKAWGATLDARWKITPWAALDVRGSWTDTTIAEEDGEDVEDRTYRAAAGILVLVFRRLQVEAGYDYRRNDSNDRQRTYDGNRFYAFMSYHFRPLPPGSLPSSYLTRMAYE